MRREEEYVIMDEDTIIGCHIHGDFLATPFEHLKGFGCPICRHEEVMKVIKSEFLFNEKVLSNIV